MHTLTPEAPARRALGRLQLLLILLVAIGPMLLATAMYKLQFWVPEGRNYDGELIGDGRTLADIGVQAPADARWQLLVTAPGTCDDTCRQLVYTARQINIGLNRDALRARHGLASSEALPADYRDQLQREYPQLGRYALDRAAYEKTAQGTQLWIVDPHGNLVLRYDATVKGKAILEDLRLLLKLSQIG
ncbi:hypothetical protein [Pseudomonas sp. LRF_L74]|uniref:hypothetical protein n=1 Tax=Pseudomonas sp. LRF_L74 TaxID=3369422 RepID=UPI003F5EDAFD